MRMLDLRDVILPFALLKVSNIFREMGRGECLEILWNSRDILSIERILPPKTFGLSLIRESETHPSCFWIKLEKTTTCAR